MLYSIGAFVFSLGLGWATPGTRVELGTRARPRKRASGKAAAKVSLNNIWPFNFFFCSTSEGVKTLFILLFIDILSGSVSSREVETGNLGF